MEGQRWITKRYWKVACCLMLFDQRTLARRLKQNAASRGYGLVDQQSKQGRRHLPTFKFCNLSVCDFL